MTFPFIIFILVTVSFIVTLRICIKLCTQLLACEPDRALLQLKTPEPHLPTLTVVIPVRNEEINIEKCLASLQKVDYPNLEILVVDDCSEDQTAPLIKQFLNSPLKHPIRLLQESDLESGVRSEWASGKSYVLWGATKHVKSEWVLFVDADTRQFPDGLWRAMSFALQRNLKALTVSGVYHNPSFWGDLMENFLYLFIFMSMPLKAINNPSRSAAWMNGQFILFHRETYLALGGHSAVKNYSFDDMSLGNETKKAGIPFLFLPNAQLYECTNYVGLKQSFTGWVRLLAGGSQWLGYGKSFFILEAFKILFLVLTPFVHWALLLSTSPMPNIKIGPVQTLDIAFAQVALLILIAIGARTGTKRSAWGAVLTPIAAGFAIAVYVRAFIVRYFVKMFIFRGRVLKPDRPF